MANYRPVVFVIFPLPQGFAGPRFIGETPAKPAKGPYRLSTSVMMNGAKRRDHSAEIWE